MVVMKKLKSNEKKWKAQVLKVLNELENFYIPGCTDYFNEMNPSPWQLVFDEMESKIKMNHCLTDEDQEKAILKFRELTEHYKKSCASGKIKVVDSLIKRDENVVLAVESRKNKKFECAEFGCSESKLKPRVRTDSIVVLLCDEHAKKLKAKFKLK